MVHSGVPTEKLTLESAFSPLVFLSPGSPLLFLWIAYQNKLPALGEQNRQLLWLKQGKRRICLHLAIYFCAVKGRINMFTDCDL